jgi:glutathione S-transferase
LNRTLKVDLTVAYPQIWPSGKADRALARAISAEMAASFLALRSNYPMNVRKRLPFGKAYFDKTPGNAKELARAVEIFKTCRARVNERDNLKKIDQGFLFGIFTAADAMFAPLCWRIKTYSLPVEDELAKQYVERLIDSDLVQQWVQEASLESEVMPPNEVGDLIAETEQQ